MTTTNWQISPVDQTPILKRYGQLPSWETGEQQLLYCCPQCEHVFRWGPSLTRQDRFRKFTDPGWLLAFKADRAKIPRWLCPTCMLMKLDGDYRIVEYVMDRGTSVGYRFEYVGMRDNRFAHQIIEVWRRDLLGETWPFAQCIDQRWPFDRSLLHRMSSYLLAGVRDAHQRDLRAQRNQHIPRAFQPLDTTIPLPYAVYDGLHPLHEPPAHWTGGIYQTETTHVYGEEAGNVPLSILLLALQHPTKPPITQEQLTFLGELRLGEYLHVLSEYRDF